LSNTLRRSLYRFIKILENTEWNIDHHRDTFGEDKDSIVTSEETILLKKFLLQSVTMSTAQSYISGINKWKEYLTSLGKKFPGYYLEKIQNDQDKGKRVVLYMAYLYLNFGLRDEQIKRLVTGVTFYFEIEGRSTSFFALAIVSRGRTAIGRTIPESRDYEEQRSKRAILPVCLDIVMAMRAKYWENKTWEVPDIDQRALWLAVAIGFDLGPRIGNITKKDGKDGPDHCIRAKDCFFLAEDPVTHTERKIEGGRLVAQFLRQPGVTQNNILSVDLYYLSSKTSRKVKSVVRHPKYLARRSEIEEIVLNDLLQWMLHSGVKSDDELLSRYCQKDRKKTVIRKDVRTAIKITVIEMGLPPDSFSNKSLRSGFSSHVIANGMGDDELKRGGGWTANSQVPNNHYNHQMRDRGAFALATSGTEARPLGIPDIRRMLPLVTEKKVSGSGMLGGTDSSGKEM
jgi:hypothetical protein